MVLNTKIQALSIIELVKSVRTVRQDWRIKTPYQKWCYFFSIGKAAFKLIAIPLYEIDQTLSWYSYFSYVYIGLYVMLVVYTAIFYTIRGEFVKSLPSTCLVTLLIAVVPLVWNLFSKNRGFYHSLVAYPGQYIYPNDRQNTAYNRICSEEMDVTALKFLIKCVAMVSGGSSGAILTIYASFWMDNKTSTVSVKVPFIDDNSDAEFYLNYALQWLIFFHACCMYFGIEITMTSFGNFATISPKLIQLQLIESITMYEKKECSEPQLRLVFKNALMQSQDYDRYLNGVKEFLYGRTFVTSFLFTYSIGMSIFCQFEMGYAAGFGLAFMSYVQLFYICETGEEIEDNGLDALLYDANWYVLPLDLQKDLMRLTNRMQNGVRLTVGPLDTINRELFKLVTKRIYSFVMFLTNFGA